MNSETKNVSGDKFAAEMAQLREDLSKLKEDVTSLAALGVREAEGLARDGLSKVEAQARHTVDATASEIKDIQQQAAQAVRRAPLTAVLGALLLGYLLGGFSRGGKT